MSVDMGRVYDDIEIDPAACFLVDRLWPRGLSKDKAPFANWLRDVAPSPDLRKWYSHDPERFDEFARRYREELAGEPGRPIVVSLRKQARGGHIMLLTATKDLQRSGAAVLRGVVSAR